jgi:Rrf2 family protein
MKLTRKSDYALRALVTLALRYGEGPVPNRELAEQNDIPKRFLEQIMQELKVKGWVVSSPGRDGGFELGVRPEQLTMGQIVRLFDGMLAPIACTSTSYYEACSQEATCRFRRVLLEIRNHSSQLMDRATLADLVLSQPVRHEEVFQRDFEEGAGI